MYDLPVASRRERKDADLFRKYLKRNGFSKIQNSVYVKLLRSHNNSKYETSEIKNNLPQTGMVNALILPIDDFCKMESLLGDSFDTELFASDLVLL